MYYVNCLMIDSFNDIYEEYNSILFDSYDECIAEIEKLKCKGYNSDFRIIELKKEKYLNFKGSLFNPSYRNFENDDVVEIYEIENINHDFILKKFNKKEYDFKYSKEHFSQVKFSISKDLKNQLYSKLEKDNLKPIDWFKICIYNYLDNEKED